MFVENAAERRDQRFLTSVTKTSPKQKNGVGAKWTPTPFFVSRRLARLEQCQHPLGVIDTPFGQCGLRGFQ